MIRAGHINEVNKNSGFWVFVDMGFSQKSRSCGILLHDEFDPREITFSALQEEIIKLTETRTMPMNLLLEAPLSIAFNEAGNPSGREIEYKAGFQPRYWYLGLGCCVLTATTHLLRRIVDSNPAIEIRLFEGFASFKQKDKRSSHKNDVLALRQAVWNLSSSAAVMPIGIAKTDRLESAFRVAGMDFGIPPIVAVEA